MGTKIEPIGDRIFCRDVKVEDRRTGYLTGSKLVVDHADKADADRDVREVIAVAVGPGFKNPSGIVTPTGVRVGDRLLVLLAGVQGKEHEKVTIDGEELRVVRIWDLLGVIEDGLANKRAEAMAKRAESAA